MWICVKNVIYFCDQTSIFSIITAVFSLTWSSEIILICWFVKRFRIINVKTISAMEYIFFLKVVASLNSDFVSHNYDKSKNVEI